MKKHCFMIFVIVQILTSCGENGLGLEPEQETVDTMAKIQILLNEGKNDMAISLIDQELSSNPSNPDLLFYKASAYSSKANINIYSLYPILEMRLLKKSASEWGELNDEKNPYIGQLEHYARISSKQELEYTEEANERDLTANNEGKTYQIEINNQKRKKVVAQILNIVWGIYESVPLIALTPQLSVSQVNDAHQALLTLLEINAQSKADQKRIKLFRSLISAILFINRIKLAVTLEEIHSPIDLLCNFDISIFISDISWSTRYLQIFLIDIADISHNNSDFEKFEKILTELNQLQTSEIEFATEEFKEKLQDEFCI